MQLLSICVLTPRVQSNITDSETKRKMLLKHVLCNVFTLILLNIFQSFSLLHIDQHLLVTPCGENMTTH